MNQWIPNRNFSTRADLPRSERYFLPLTHDQFGNRTPDLSRSGPTPLPLDHELRQLFMNHNKSIYLSNSFFSTILHWHGWTGHKLMTIDLLWVPPGVCYASRQPVHMSPPVRSCSCPSHCGASPWEQGQGRLSCAWWGDLMPAAQTGTDPDQTCMENVSFYQYPQSANLQLISTPHYASTILSGTHYCWVVRWSVISIHQLREFEIRMKRKYSWFISMVHILYPLTQ